MHTLYTTYLSNEKNIPKSAVKIVIMRMPPYYVTTKDDLIHRPQLSPSRKILLDYKEDNDWDKFKSSFEQQMENDIELLKDISYIIEALEFNDVCLICCEKDANYCHRTLLANLLKALGVKHIEL